MSSKHKNDDGEYSFSSRNKRRKSIGVGKPKEKYNRILSMEMTDINTTDDLRDAIILFFRLPSIEKLAEEEQLRLMKQKYDVVNDYLTPFQQEELFEIAQYMNELDNMKMYSTLHKYDDEIKRAFELKPKKVEELKMFKSLMNEKGDKSNHFCAGCGLPLKYDADTADWRFWRAYKTDSFQHFSSREFMFHNRLCVKLRKAKQVVREMVKQNQNQTNEQAMTVDFFSNPFLDESFRPTKIFTTFDESNLYVKYKENIRFYRKQVKQTDYMSFDIDEGDRWGAVPEPIKYLDLREFALPLAQFCIYQAKIKEFDGFWTLLSFLSSHIDTPTMLELLDDHVHTLFPLHSQKNRVLLQWLTTICEGSVYPIATCLYIAAFIEENGPNYFSEEEAESLYRHYVNMALSLMAETESEHLTAIMLEMPTNIDHGKSVLDIAIENKMLEFLQSPKISNLATTLWYERKIIHPRHTYGSEVSWLKMYRRLIKKPAKFYFSPAGANITRIMLFMLYLGQFCYVTFKLKYNINHVSEEMESSEYFLWWFNLGQVMGVCYGIFSKPGEYFSHAKNMLEVIIALLWILLALMEFGFPVDVEETFSYDVESTISSCTSGNCTYTSTVVSTTVVLNENNAEDLNLQVTRNTVGVEVYMALWSLQCVIFWGKVIFFFQRLRSVGPLITMISLMLRDITNFLILSSIFLLGIVWAMYYVIGGDLEDVEFEIDGQDECACLGPISSVFEYCFHSFLGQQEWDFIGSSDDGISSFRSRLLEALIMVTEIAGFTLLLNLLVAMLKSTFLRVRERAVLEVNYTRVVDSYYASRGDSLIQAPLNHFTGMVMCIWVVCDMVVTTLTGSSRMLNDWYFTPLNKNAFAVGDEIIYQQYDQGGNKIGTAKGFVHSVHTSEVAIVKVAGKKKLIHKNDIIKTEKSITIERPKLDHSKSKESKFSCAARSGRYYCKFCRFQFVGDQVGSIDSVVRQFAMYGIQMDPDDVGRVKSMLGESIAKSPTTRLNFNAQLCPECSRPFRSREDHGDEVGRIQFVGEISSFWVFCMVWIIFVIVLAPFGLLSFVGSSSSVSKKKKQQREIEKEANKVQWSEPNDIHRARVRQVFDNETTNERRLENARAKMQTILKRIRESKHENDQDNIATRMKDEVREKALNLTANEAFRRAKRLETLHKEMMDLCTKLNSELKDMIRAKKGMAPSK